MITVAPISPRGHESGVGEARAVVVSTPVAGVEGGFSDLFKE